MTTARVLAAFVLAPALALGGCGDADNGPEQQDELNEFGADTLEAAPAAAAPGDTVDVVLTEWSIEMTTDSVRPGTVAFRVRNDGEYTHAFEVEGGGAEWETENLAPGQTEVLTTELSAGDYEVYCPVEDDHGPHDDLGMRDSLAVR
ncbi:MAG: cupredoxin domain-containing protein [Longimicrobiales bacterium]